MSQRPRTLGSQPPRRSATHASEPCRGQETGEVDEIVASNAFIDPWKVMLRRLFTEGVCIDKDTFLETMRPLCGACGRST